MARRSHQRSEATVRRGAFRQATSQRLCGRASRDRRGRIARSTAEGWGGGPLQPAGQPWRSVGRARKAYKRCRARAAAARTEKLKKPNPCAPCRISSAFTTRLGAVATSVSIPLISAEKLRGITSRLGDMPRFCEMRSTTGMKMATTAVELIKEPRPPTAAISRMSKRFSLPPALASSQSPSRRATPVLTRPSPITNSAAISMIDGSANLPAPRSW